MEVDNKRNNDEQTRNTRRSSSSSRGVRRSSGIFRGNRNKNDRNREEKGVERVSLDSRRRPSSRKQNDNTSSRRNNGSRGQQRSQQNNQRDFLRAGVRGRNAPRKKKRTSYPEGALPEIKSSILAQQQNVESKEIPTEYMDLYDSAGHQRISFDEALQKVQDSIQIAEDETIIYAGAGNFAVIGVEVVDRKKKQVVRRKIEFERVHGEEAEWREDFRYDLNKAYEPNPDPLSSLYTDEEIADFPLNK